MSARTVLVTGGTGFIGSHVARALADSGDDVVLLDLRAPGPEAERIVGAAGGRVRFHQAGIDDRLAIRAACLEHGITDVVHMAAITNTSYLHDHPMEAFTVNLGGTINVLEVVRELALRRLVYFSTVGVLPAIQYEPIDARHPIVLGGEGSGAGFYGSAKAAGELFCFGYRDAFGLDFVAIRPSAVYGFGMQVPIFVKPIVENSVRGLPTRVENGRDFGRDYTHVTDLAQLTKRALDAPAEAVRDRVFYGATGGPLVTPGQVADIVRELIPGADIEIGGGLSDDDRWKSRFRGVIDIGPARAQLGYEPRFASIHEGIAEYIESYRSFVGREARAAAPVS
ncbi:MAG: NAD-dependent epimerase/dehydratase family protein [Candidatus Limnocylindria bacterium]